jgi:hypothetical protein
MQETPAEKLLPGLVEKLKAGTDLKTLVAAGSLANARTFGGQDYIGFHTLMALPPAFEMARELPESERALPVLKVLYRNTTRIQEKGGSKEEVLHPITEPLSTETLTGEELRQATRKADYQAAEKVFASIAQHPPGEAFNHLQFAVQDEVDVHRVVLAWRAFSLLDFTGKEQAHTLLRQSVRYCVQSENYRLTQKRAEPEVRTILPKLLDQHKLLKGDTGSRSGDDTWVRELAKTIYGKPRPEAAEAVAIALREGYHPDAISEAIALAANWLVLHDPGRPKAWASANKPEGSVHGDSVGVHASDAANAWRQIARVSNPRNRVASLIVAAYHTAGQSGNQLKEPYPLAEVLEKITSKDADVLLKDLDAAIREKDQARACALVHRYGELKLAPRPVFDLLLKFAISEDGALHAEKYYRTVIEEFTTMRATFRWQQLSALARVTASEFGYPAPGYTEAKRLIKG